MIWSIVYFTPINGIIDKTILVIEALTTTDKASTTLKVCKNQQAKETELNVKLTSEGNRDLIIVNDISNRSYTKFHKTIGRTVINKVVRIILVAK